MGDGRRRQEGGGREERGERSTLGDDVVKNGSKRIFELLSLGCQILAQLSEEPVAVADAANEGFGIAATV